MEYQIKSLGELGLSRYTIDTLGVLRDTDNDKPKEIFYHCGYDRRFRMTKIEGGEIKYVTYQQAWLMAWAFLPNPEGAKQVAFIDGDFFNVKLSNIMWKPLKNPQKKKIVVEIEGPEATELTELLEARDYQVTKKQRCLVVRGLKSKIEKLAKVLGDKGYVILECVKSAPVIRGRKTERRMRQVINERGEIFKSGIAGGVAYGLSPTAVLKAIRTKHRAGGVKWMHLEDYQENGGVFG